MTVGGKSINGSRSWSVLLPENEEKVVRYLEILGIAIVIISLFLPFGSIPIFTGEGSNIFGGYYWSDVSLLGFSTSSSGSLIAAILLGIGLFMIITKVGGQVLVITSTTSIVLITLAEERLFPLDLGVSVIALAIGSGLCSAKFIIQLLKE